MTGGPGKSPDRDGPSVTGVITMFYCSDLEATARWYEEGLGLTRLKDFEGFVLFGIGETSMIGLVAAGYGSQQPIAGCQKGAIVSIQTDDLDAWHRQLISSGLRQPGGSFEIGAEGRTREFKLFDPEGYTIEVFQWL